MPVTRTDEEIIKRMMALAEGRYNCSQILMVLALEQAGRENPELVRAMAGLADGCGFFKETCGILTGGCSILALYSAKGADTEEESEKLLLMVEEYGDWFEKEVGRQYGGTRCIDITKELAGTPDVKQICGGLVFTAHKKLVEILSHHGFI
jgi:C_GCAxxG_C_C family probable redox protein